MYTVYSVCFDMVASVVSRFEKIVNGQEHADESETNRNLELG